MATDDLIIRGLDRNEVVLEGRFELENGVRVVEADGVAVENLTVQNYTGNGVFWTGVDGYRGTYVSTIRNGDYGVYAFGSVSTGSSSTPTPRAAPTPASTSGSASPATPDRQRVSGVERRGVSGTNSGGDLSIVNSSSATTGSASSRTAAATSGAPPAGDHHRGELRPRQRQPRHRRLEAPSSARTTRSTWSAATTTPSNATGSRITRSTDIVLCARSPRTTPIDDIPTGDELTLSCEEASALPGRTAR